MKDLERNERKTRNESFPIKKVTSPSLHVAMSFIFVRPRNDMFPDS